MRAIFCCCFLVLFLHIIGTAQDQDQKTLQIIQTSNEGLRMKLLQESRASKEISKAGSSPPSCLRKCYGCRPCEAIKVLTVTAHVTAQYTNYEPEGWMCKCGPTFYSP